MVSFAASTTFAAGSIPISAAVADFNGDGKQDLAVSNLGLDSVSILLGTGTGSFSAATNFAAGSDPRSVAVGDFNGDGKPDLATANNTITITGVGVVTVRASQVGDANFNAAASVVRRAAHELTC